MAKKAAKKIEPDREERTGTMTPEVLAGISAELRDVESRIDGIAISMKKAAIEGVHIDGFSKPKRALRLLLEYINQAKYRLAEEGIRRGDGL